MVGKIGSRWNQGLMGCGSGLTTRETTASIADAEGGRGRRLGPMAHRTGHARGLLVAGGLLCRRLLHVSRAMLGTAICGSFRSTFLRSS